MTLLSVSVSAISLSFSLSLSRHIYVDLIERLLYSSPLTRTKTNRRPVKCNFSSVAWQLAASTAFSVLLTVLVVPLRRPSYLTKSAFDVDSGRVSEL